MKSIRDNAKKNSASVEFLGRFKLGIVVVLEEWLNIPDGELLINSKPEIPQAVSNILVQFDLLSGRSHVLTT